MKRDIDLIRKILLVLESQEHGFFREPLVVDGYTEEQIGYHVHLLGEAGLLKVRDHTHLQSMSPEAFPISITWAGHEFIDAAKDESIWEKAKTKVLKPIGGVALDVLLEWLKAEAKQRIGLLLPPGGGV